MPRQKRSLARSMPQARTSLRDKAILATRRRAWRLEKLRRRQERDALLAAQTHPIRLWLQDLPPRKRDIAYLLCCGYTPLGIAKKLGISRWNAACVDGQLMRKFKANRVMLARMAIRDGFVSVDSSLEPVTDIRRGN